MKDLVTVGNMRIKYTTRGNVTGYEASVRHNGLHEYRVLSARETYVLEQKIENQLQKWREKWDQVLAQRKREETRETNKAEAERLTREALEKLTAVENILLHTLDVNDAVNWNSLKRKKPFSKTWEGASGIKFDHDGRPIEAIPKEYPAKPLPEHQEFVPKLSFFDKIIPSRKRRKIAEYAHRYETSLGKWKEACRDVDADNAALQEYCGKLLAHWEEEKRRYNEETAACNSKIDDLKARYLKKEPDAILEYCDLVLNSSNYLNSFPKDYELDFNSETRILIVDYLLPSKEHFPTLQEVRYVASKNELKESHLNEAALNKMFDSAVYKITLRTLHELFEADTVGALSAISFNGWVDSLDTATGKRQIVCILTIQAGRQEFLEIDLRHVDPKACFKKLKGVGSSKLSGITPVRPILQINRSDSRFIDGYDVANTLDESTNLAAMDWADFEHLIRELFEKEFSSTGGEVKITQASHDRGVDAVAFDPDPIRGGKIVIQAKRYTNTVDVSAVRDLYGTVLNEGATKGILVTTTDYGPDAYDFAKDKPLTLLTGGNLLHLLAKHGHKAKIDIKEAKRILAEQG